MLVLCRTLALVAVWLYIARPVLLLPPVNVGDVVVPILVDTSKSMRIADVDGRPRVETVKRLLTERVIPAAQKVGKVEIYRVGETFAETTVVQLTSDARRTDLSAAVDAVRNRFRGRRTAGVLLFSDGGDTAAGAINPQLRSGVSPLFAVGLGSTDGPPDREVVGITAGDPRLDRALVDVHVTTLSRGLGKDAYQIRLLENGQVVETRKVTPRTDGSPVDEAFQVTSDPLNATVVAAEIVADPRETILENNSRTVLLSPAVRKRRLLVLAGSPGYEHSFLVRALSVDPSFEIDSIVRKGKDDSGRDTFLIQATGGRGNALTSGFPQTRDALFTYDGVIIGNLEGDFFGKAQMEMLADFVSVRGGGLLLLGARTFLQRGIAGSPMEAALPIELNDRLGGAALRQSGGNEGVAVRNLVTLTPEGATHPIMRIAETPDATRKLWSEMPPLASSSPVGGPRPGATVLAVTESVNGAAVPLVAIQRYGRGRSMVFSGEASWRWKMLRPASDRTYEVFWRQATRWLTSDAPDPVTITVPGNAMPGESIAIQLEARNREFVPVAEPTVEATVTTPGAEPKPLSLRASGRGQAAATIVADLPGLYRIRADARQGATLLGSADAWFYVGGADPEFADPRLNEEALRRLARASGGQYAAADDIDSVLNELAKAPASQLEPVRRDLWHAPWTLAIVLLALSAEWILRRLWGMR